MRRNASAIAVAHNHPSGDPAPSAYDIAFTEAVVEAGALLEIRVLATSSSGTGGTSRCASDGSGSSSAREFDTTHVPVRAAAPAPHS